jgi:diguanylate cyclase (GGDEF)-like protein
MMVDVNGFKQVNDRLGHQTGDLVLKQVAQELKTLLRQSDILARLGGDEFVIGLPETHPSQAAAVADKLRHVRIPMTDRARHGLGPVTLSVGLSIPAQAGETSQQLLEAADRSLYDEKRRRASPVRPTQ